MLLRELFEQPQQGGTAVLGWGRGMGHKGHMLLAKAVLHHARELSAKPYFVVSRTSLVDPGTGQPWTDRQKFTKTKDDPLTPEEKLNTYRKVFPQDAEVFTVATADATKLEQVIAKIAQDGYNKIILVVGEDQKESMQYLLIPDKSGVAPYKAAGIEELKIISRQDTTEPSSMRSSPEYQEGPRATPMRQVLLDPSKSEEEQFAVWRRDMPDDLSDEEVRDLMLKAKQRMMAVPPVKKPVKKDATENVLGLQEEENVNALRAAVYNFYKPVMPAVHKGKVEDYVEQAKELISQAPSISIKNKLIDIFKKGKENPYLQGGIITTIGALLAGGILQSSQKFGLTPQQTNIALQAALNIVIPTLVSRINGKNWADTIKYTLASAGVGTGIATVTELYDKEDL